jgi:hypothetical protein
MRANVTYFLRDYNDDKIFDELLQVTWYTQYGNHYLLHIAN